ncbi:MAG: hypothetical protein HZA48_01965 [Planctomycetes bacterium]|nr:hypothetical protein [Planctomycetota bacterium]
MDLKNFYAFNIKEKEENGPPNDSQKIISRVNRIFDGCLDDNKLILTPRFAGNYISLRYCGLEILQLKQDEIFGTIEEKNKKIYRVKKYKVKEKSGDNKVAKLIKIVHDAITEKSFFEQEKKARKIPGFGLEHWLESMILGDTGLGKSARLRLDLKDDLKEVVSQAPVICKPKKDGKMKRHRHIDIFGISSQGKTIIIELKKDNDFKKAKEELLDYSNWLLGKLPEADKERGNIQAMIAESYMPKTFLKTSETEITAIAVGDFNLNDSEKDIKELKNGIKLKIVQLDKEWYYTNNAKLFHPL